MKPKQVSRAITTYMDEFTFVEAKKYLALKGPLRLNVVHDRMYPLFRFNTEIFLRKPHKGQIKEGQLACYWHNEILHPCIIKRVLPEGEYSVFFLNGEAPTRTFTESHYLGEIIFPKPNIWYKLKLWWLKRR